MCSACWTSADALGRAGKRLLHLHLDSGRGLRALVDAFEPRGYRWAYRVVNSLAFLPQRRERVLFVATTTDVDPAGVLFADEVDPPEPRRRSRPMPPASTGPKAYGDSDGSGGVPTLKNGSTVGIASPPAICCRAAG